MLKDHIHYLHIKDALPDGSVVPAGKGDGNIAAIIKDYLARGGREMTLEPHLAVFDGLKGLEESGDVSVVGQKYTFASAEEAFDAGCDALKSVLQEVSK
jgi:sugar phosphate isomerase/epimerase